MSYIGYMIKEYAQWIIISTILGLSIFFGGRFIYRNVIVPWPYRHELRACLDKAKQTETKDLEKYERNICFRTYPHFL